jgi:hypothetical protein
MAHADIEMVAIGNGQPSAASAQIHQIRAVDE